MILDWKKCSGSQWCSLLKLDLNHAHFQGLEGIYIIWHGAPHPAVVRIGQGNIRERLLEHRSDPKILQYQNHSLFVTWVFVERTSRDGIEAYLAEKWRPKVGEKFPSVLPIIINSPWDK